VLSRIAKGPLPPGQGFGIAVQGQCRLRHGRPPRGVSGNERLEPDAHLVEPPLVLFVGQPPKHLVLRHDALRRRVREEKLAGLKAILLGHPAGRQVYHPRFAGHNEPIVVGHPVATRT
jgi:hypothetical protein